jgi:hypothetical protein
MAKHFKIGGSTAKRTLRCPAWVTKASKLPQINRSSAAAERGTAMHEVLELMLNHDDLESAMAKVGYDFDSYDVDQMVIAYQAVETLWERYKIEEFETEPLMSVAEDVGGSADIVAAGHDWTLIADFKFGRSPVDPINNPQILFYHWLATQDETVRDLTLDRKLIGAIIQPAVSKEPLIYEYSEEEVAVFDHDIREAIASVRTGTENATAGSHCEYCPVEPYCAERRDLLNQVRLMPLDQMNNLSASLSLIDELKAFIKATEDEADRVMKDLGVKIPGYKLVAKKELRKFSDPFKTAAALTTAGVKDIYAPPALKTPSQLEKVLKAEKMDFDFTPWLKPPSGELEIAPATDKRAEVVLNPKNISAILANNLANKG